MEMKASFLSDAEFLDFTNVSHGTKQDCVVTLHGNFDDFETDVEFQFRKSEGRFFNHPMFKDKTLVKTSIVHDL